MIILQAAHILRFKGIDDIVIQDCGAVNAFYGRNNSGKSTILHAIDMAGLALSTRSWDAFQPKLEIRDMFHEAGPFEIELTYGDGSKLTVRQQAGGFGPTFDPQPTEEQRFSSIYIVPDPGLGLVHRHHMTPKSVMQYIQNRDFSTINGLDILFALKFYASRSERGLQKNDYECIVNDIQSFFPEIEQIISDRTEDDVATLTYHEYGRDIDVIYAGAGLKHFVDIFVKVTLSQASVVLIDEPEVGLHPSLQRELLVHLLRLNEEKGTQFFIATHSPVFLCEPEKVMSFIIQNRRGLRAAVHVPNESLYTVWGDLGIRPGDLLQNDIVVLVEGQSDVIFFEHVLKELYGEEFRDIAIAVVQYGGDAAAGITDGTISVQNLVPGKGFRLWIRDRDSSSKESPAPGSTKFKNALEKNGEMCHILEKRELEFYFPEDVHIEAQQGDGNREQAVQTILNGDQSAKFKKLAEESHCALAQGKTLRKLLRKHLRRDNIDPEMCRLVEEILVPWRKKILGVENNTKLTSEDIGREESENPDLNDIGAN